MKYEPAFIKISRISDSRIIRSINKLVAGRIEAHLPAKWTSYDVQQVVSSRIKRIYSRVKFSRGSDVNGLK